MLTNEKIVENAKHCNLRGDTESVENYLDLLAERLAAHNDGAQEQVGKAEPIAWIRFCGDGLYEGPIMNCDRRKMDEIVRVKPDEWRALVLRNDSMQENGCLTRKSMQEKALEHGFEYWRAPDEHGITGTKPQCIEFLQDLLGVEVEIEDNGCQTCNGTGMIGGPSFYAPDEGGEPCPDCCDTPSYCSSVRRCTAQDAEQPSERVKQECPHGVEDGACKQCYGEATSGEQVAATFPRGFKVEHIEGHGWIIDPPSGAPWVAYEGSPAGELMQALAASAPTLGDSEAIRDAAMRTVQAMGYEYAGGERWRPSFSFGERRDDVAVDAFARAMKVKMAEAHAKGRSGWEDMNPSDLSRMLRTHVEKGDPLDVANYGMMLWHHGAPIAPAVAQPLTDTLRGYFETIVKYLEADLPGLALNTAEKARALLEAKGE